MEYEKIYTSAMSDSQWETVERILKEAKYRCVAENGIQLLSESLYQWYMAENTAGIGERNTHQSRKESRTGLCTD